MIVRILSEPRLIAVDDFVTEHEIGEDHPAGAAALQPSLIQPPSRPQHRCHHHLSMPQLRAPSSLQQTTPSTCRSPRRCPIKKLVQRFPHERTRRRHAHDDSEATLRLHGPRLAKHGRVQLVSYSSGQYFGYHGLFKPSNHHADADGGQQCLLARLPERRF